MTSLHDTVSGEFSQRLSLNLKLEDCDQEHRRAIQIMGFHTDCQVQPTAEHKTIAAGCMGRKKPLYLG